MSKQMVIYGISCKSLRYKDWQRWKACMMQFEEAKAGYKMVCMLWLQVCKWFANKKLKKFKMFIMLPRK